MIRVINDFYIPVAEGFIGCLNFLFVGRTKNTGEAGPVQTFQKSGIKQYKQSSTHTLVWDQSDLSSS